MNGYKHDEVYSVHSLSAPSSVVESCFFYTRRYSLLTVLHVVNKACVRTLLRSSPGLSWLFSGNPVWERCTRLLCSGNRGAVEGESPRLCCLFALAEMLFQQGVYLWTSAS